MNKHQEFIQMIAVYDDLTSSEQLQVDAHLATCPQCKARLDAYRAMDHDLQQLPRLRPEKNLRQDFYTQLESNMKIYRRNKQMCRVPAFAVQILVVGALILLGFSFWSNLRQEKVPLAAPNIPVTVESSTPLAIVDITFEDRSYSPGETVTFLIFWHNAQTSGEEMISLRLLDFESGTPIAQRDEPLNIMVTEQNMSLHELTLPAEVDDGAYPLEISVYNENTGKRIPIPTESVTASQPVVVGDSALTFSPTPILETAVIRLESWSPNGKYLTFREYTEAEIRNGDVGIQRVYDVESEKYCPHAIDVRPGNVDNWFAWVSDEAFAYLSVGGNLVMRSACDLSLTYVTQQTTGEKEFILAQSNDFNTLLIDSTEGYSLDNPVYSVYTPLVDLPEDLIVIEATFSPNNEVLTIVDEVGTILFVNTSNGNVLQTISWQLENQIPDLIWLGNDLLLARPLPLPEEHTLITTPVNPDPEAHSSPFIVDLDGNITPLDALFNTEIDDTKQILAASDLERSSYTILLYTDPQLGEPAPVRVYHSATDTVEVLPYTEIWQGGITEDGRFLLTSEERNFGYGRSTGHGVMGEEFEFELDLENDEIQINMFERVFLVREITAVGEAFTQFMSTGPSEIPTAPDRQLMGFFSAGLLYDTSSYPIIIQANQWFNNLGFSDRKDILWSPDTQHVAVVGGIEGTNQSQLFILDTKPSPPISNQTEETLTPARVVNTRLEGLPLRTIPGGELIGTLSEGTLVSILENIPTQEVNNLTWQKVRTYGFVEGWVVAEFLVPADPVP